MTAYVALLRGIMPSNPNMKNDKLRAVFERLGYERVGSVLASGNIVFHTDDPAGPAMELAIQHALRSTLGIDGGTIVRSLDELLELMESDPFAGLTHGRGSYLIATFVKDGAPAPGKLPDDPDPRTKVIGFDPAARAFLTVVDNSEPGRTPEFMRWLEKTYGKNITTRTWLTIEKVVQKLQA
ncbi:DUF1697 domain-containing protein [Yimella sp. cx-51]|uniref:DUF1697 domain-containing protein n=1 Tax=Yimella sp. cx-51 TaxID=2770551 RepID=UPI00165EA591|nr:DUF1697 domain-containing protein [Yimella sp. cx-51]MBC9957925.1 DUF1697 domain-containing protein [Yimella sp. cx-51]QTH38059.1 DUF1697 domain-containing protein [Yimella sp. cx-51]